MRDAKLKRARYCYCNALTWLGLFRPQVARYLGHLSKKNSIRNSAGHNGPMRPFESKNMPKKPVFMMALRDREPIATPYNPLIYTRMHECWRFALHKSGRMWIVSDPVSGAKICTVSATYKGMPVASGDLSLKHARAMALIDLDLLVDRIGIERFSKVLAIPKPF